MLFWGTIVNCIGIVVGGLIGLFFRERLSPALQKIALQALGLSVLVVGFQMALKTQSVIQLCAAMVLGALVGEWLNIEGWFEKFGRGVKKLVRSNHAKFVDGFVAASILYCVGSMAIVGSIEEAVQGSSSVLYAKTMIDALYAMAFAATLGIGVIFSVISVALYQGLLTLGAFVAKDSFSTEVIVAVSSTGGLLVATIGLHILEILKVKVANLLPALLFAAILAAYFS